MLSSIPAEHVLSMRLLYRDDVTPVNYEPEHFRALRPTDESVEFDVEPHTMRLGQVLYVFEEPG